MITTAAIKPMLAPSEIPEPEDLRFPLLASRKLNGVRCLIVPGLGPVSRTGRPLPNVRLSDWLAAAIAWADRNDWVLDGELYSETSTLGEISGAVSSRDGALPADLKLYVFDGMPAADWGGTAGPFRDRLAALAPVAGLARVELLAQKTVRSARAAWKLFEAELAAGGEGIVLRDPNGPYKHGRCTLRQGILYKLKNFDPFDGRVVAVERGRGRYAGVAGSVVVELDDGSRCKVGLGFSDAERAVMAAEPAAYVGRWLEFRAMTLGGVRCPGPATLLRWRAGDETGKV